MSNEYLQILERALALPQKELFQVLDRRVDGIRSGKTKAVSSEEVMKKLKKKDGLSMR